MDIYESVLRFYESVGTEKRIIGKSLTGRKLVAIKLGEGKPVGIAQYALHGREYITAKLALHHYATGGIKGSCWILPLTNPDGALLSQTGVASVADKWGKRLIQINGGTDFSLWKANARGVDLNVNFDALWGCGVKNLRYPNAENYIGTKPFSEPETQALKAFTEKIKPDYTVSYHTKGEEVYWYFHQSFRDCLRDKALALALCETTGYKLAYAKGSVGGYKDWCIRRFGIPSFTVEAGAESWAHPITETELPRILDRNERALQTLSKGFTK